MWERIRRGKRGERSIGEIEKGKGRQGGNREGVKMGGGEHGDQKAGKMIDEEGSKGRGKQGRRREGGIKRKGEIGEKRTRRKTEGRRQEHI